MIDLPYTGSVLEVNHGGGCHMVVVSASRSSALALALALTADADMSRHVNSLNSADELITVRGYASPMMHI